MGQVEIFSVPLHSEPGSLQMVQTFGRSHEVKIATYRMGGESRVGVIDENNQTVSPFDIPTADAARSDNRASAFRSGG